MQRERETYCEELAFTIMEAEKSQDLLSVSWRHRGTSGGLVWKPAGQKPEKSQCFSSTPRQGKTNALAWNRQKGSPLTWRRVSLFVLFRPSTDCIRPTHIGENNLLLLWLPTQMLISSKNTITDTLKIMFDQLYGYPVDWSSWHIKLSRWASN